MRYIQNGEDLDLLFLDIELDTVTGIDIGKSLRREFHNDFVQIVFISSKEHYAIQLFSVRPLNFLVKPINYRKVESIMDEYNRLFKFQHSYFEYHVGKQTHQINEQSISLVILLLFATFILFQGTLIRKVVAVFSSMALGIAVDDIIWRICSCFNLIERIELFANLITSLILILLILILE